MEDLPIPSFFPPWLRKIRKREFERFQQIPAPKKKEESWRFGDLEGMDISSFTSSSFKERTVKVNPFQIYFLNGFYLTSSEEEFGEIKVLPFSQAIEKYSHIFQEFLKLPAEEIGLQKMASQHMASWQDGCFIYAPEGKKQDAPIQIIHLFEGKKKMSFPFLFVYAEKNSSLHLQEIFSSTEESEKHFCCARKTLFVRENASVSSASIQRMNRSSRFVQFSEVEVDRKGKSADFFCNLGAKWVRREVISRLIAPEAESQMLSFSLGREEDVIDQRTLQKHLSQNTYSDLLYKNILYDKAKSIFSGLINVSSQAHETDAYQICRNLLMSKKSQAHSLPGLEIHADRVKCSHGSTSASINQDDLFYFLTRGIDVKMSKFLIALGFGSEIFERIEKESSRKLILDFIQEVFSELE